MIKDVFLALLTLHLLDGYIFLNASLFAAMLRYQKPQKTKAE